MLARRPAGPRGRAMSAALRLVVMLALSPGAVHADAPVASVPDPVAAPILNGTPTGGHPEVAALGMRQQNGNLGTCSGTLIAPTVVLTAAHCLVGAVVGGAVLFPNGDTETRLEIVAREFAVHPEYRGRPHADIGLMFLSTPVDGIAPAVLPSRPPRSRQGVIVGFGRDGLRPALVKRVGTVKLKKRCPRRARPRIGLRRRELSGSVCWKPKPGSADICPGDSGGPLFVDGEVVGVHSAGITASPVGCPGLLSWSTDVSRFRDWIDAALAGEDAP